MTLYGSFYYQPGTRRIEGYSKNMNCFMFFETQTLGEKISIDPPAGGERKFLEEKDSPWGYHVKTKNRTMRFFRFYVASLAFKTPLKKYFIL